MNSKIQFVLSYFVFSCAAQLISIGSIVAAALGYDGVIKTAIIVGVQAVANLVALTLVNSRAATSTLVPSLGFPFVAIFIAIAAVNSFLSLAWFACWFASLVVAALLTASLTAHVRGFFAEEWQSLNRFVQMAHVASALVAFAASPIMYTYLGLSSIFYTSAGMIVLSFVTFQISCRTYQEKKSIYAPSNTSKIGERSEFDRSNYGFAMNLFYWCTLGLFTVVEVNILKHRFDASPSTISSIFVVAILTSLLTLRVLPLDRLIKNPAYFIFVAAAMACGFSVLYFNTKSIYIVYLSIVGMGIADGCFKLSISMILQQITSETIRLKAFVKQRLAQYLGTLVAVMLLAFFDQGNSPMLLTSIAVGTALMMMVVSSRYRGRLTPAIIIAPIAFVLMPAVGKADVFMVGLPSTPSQLDPSRVTDVSTAAITGQVFDSLYEYTVTNDLVPRLAKKHILSPDGLQIRITLDQTQRFSDGANLRATDVEKSLIRTISILKEESRWAFGNIKGFDAFITGSTKSCEGIRALSEDTIEFKFDRPFPLFLKILATPYFAISKSSSTNQQIGTGEFMIKSRDSGVVILARKNNLEPKKN